MHTNPFGSIPRTTELWDPLIPSGLTYFLILLAAIESTYPLPGEGVALRIALFIL